MDLSQDLDAVVKEDISMDAPTARTWKDEQLAFDVWKYYGGVGGADKDTMIKIVIWLLGISAGIIAFYATDKLGSDIATVLLLVLGIAVSLLAAFTALLYGAYAAWNWAIADRIAEAYQWTEQLPAYNPMPTSDAHRTASFPLRLAKPCVDGLAPVFWVFFAASLVSGGAHVVLLVSRYYP
jgi:hypothetical protein